MTSQLNNLKFTDVFTPRRSDVNETMYIHRPELEKNLTRWLNENMHGFLFGESGNGKTWLYKKVFSENNVNYAIANCGLTSVRGSIRNVIFSSIMPSTTSIVTGYTETKSTQIDAIVAKGDLSHQKQFEKIQEDPLLQSFKELNKKNKSEFPSIIVLDNIEALLTDQEAMNELANIILLLDDTSYAPFNVKFLLVGVPCGVIEYYSKAINRSSIGNRIRELLIVNGLSNEETIEFMQKGFNDHLNCDFQPTTVKAIGSRIFEKTLGVPLQIHSYCLELCYALEDNSWIFKSGLFDTAEKEWLLSGLRESYAAIEQYFSRNKSEGIKEQVLFVIGKIRVHQFHRDHVIEILKKEFPPDEKNNISQRVGRVLSDFSKGNQPLLAKNPISGNYTVVNPRIIMCLRVALLKNQNHQIEKKGFLINKK